MKLFGKKKLVTLIQTMRIYSLDVVVEFCIENYALQIMKSWKREIMVGIELQIQGSIGMLGEEKNSREY